MWIRICFPLWKSFSLIAFLLVMKCKLCLLMLQALPTDLTSLYWSLASCSWTLPISLDFHCTYCIVTLKCHFTSFNFLHILLCCKMPESVLPGDLLFLRLDSVGIKVKKSIHHPSFIWAKLTLENCNSKEKFLR